MAIKSGFGIEHETHFVKPRGQGRFETSSGDISSGTKYGIKRDYDPTVHSSLELVSTDPTKKPHTIISNLIKREKEGRGYVAPFGNVLGTDKTNVGSYHFNMTMPYDEDKIKNKQGLDKYHNKVKQGMRNLRWLEPLMMGVIGGSTEKSIGNPDQPEGSARQYSDSYANVGGTHIGEDDSVYRQAGGSTKKFKEWFDMTLRSQTSGHSQEVGKYGNRGNNLGLDKNLNRSSYNSNRSIGDFTLKGYTPNNEDGNNPKTIEFRFPDSFSSAGVGGLMNFVTFAMENGQNTSMVKDARTEKVWKEALREIMEEGWNAQVDRKYFEKMAKDMNLDVDLPAGKTIRTDIGFEVFNDALHKKNKGGFWVKNFLKNNKKPEVHNFNRDCWQYNYKVMMSKNPSLESHTNKFLKKLAQIDTSRSNGWMNIEIKDKKIVIRDLITDVIGLEYSAEDYKDILFLLESEGIIKIKSLPNGELDKIKLMKELKTSEDIDKIIKKMKENKNFFTDKYGLEDAPEVVLPPVARETRPETIRPYAPEGTVVRGETAPTSNHYSVIYADRLPEVLGDLVTTMEDILVETEFKDENGTILNWKIRIAEELKIDGQSVNSVFVRSRGDKVFLILKASAITSNVAGDDGEQRALTQWADVIGRGLYDGSTGRDGCPTADDTNVFVRKLRASIQEMFSKMKRVNHLKQNSRKIMLSKAGIKTLQSKGIRLVSVPKQSGREYYLVTRGNYRQARQKYGNNLRFINSIPYYKSYNVIIQGNTIILYKENNIVQRVML